MNKCAAEANISSDDYYDDYVNDDNVKTENENEIDEVIDLFNQTACLADNDTSVSELEHGEVLDALEILRENWTTSSYKSAYPQYRLENARINSFGDYFWPVSMKQTPKDLAEAGFFYSGKGDATICFSCGGGMRDWNPEDIPWEEHALHFGKCKYVNVVKGSEFISMVKEKKNKERRPRRGKETGRRTTTTTKFDTTTTAAPPATRE